MTLDRIFMPRPQPVAGKRVAPLGEWPEKRQPTPEQIQRNARARQARYRAKLRGAA